MNTQINANKQCQEYTMALLAFINRHGANGDWHVVTSPMESGGRYFKNYIFDDGAIWYEAMTPVVEKKIFEHRGLDFVVPFKMLRTEYWSSDNACSRFYYEVY